MYEALRPISWAPAETQLETIACPVCGGADFKFLIKAANLHLNPELFTRKGYAPYPMDARETAVSQCRSCGLVLANPRRVSRDLIGLNNALHLVKDYKDGQVESGEVLTGEGDRALREERMRGILRFKTAGKFLDVGCGAGRDLDLAVEHGFEAYGVELSEVKKDFYKNKKFQVHVGAFEDAPFAEKSFDVITMWDVLEHVEDPNAVLAKVRSLLKPDGLFVAKVPNHAAWNRRVHGKDWDMYHPLHLYYFTLDTLQPLLQKHGLRVVHAASVNPYGLGCTIKDAWEGLVNPSRSRSPLRTLSAILRLGPSAINTAVSKTQNCTKGTRSLSTGRVQDSRDPFLQSLTKTAFRAIDYLPKRICLRLLAGNFLIVYAR